MRINHYKSLDTQNKNTAHINIYILVDKYIIIYDHTSQIV